MGDSSQEQKIHVASRRRTKFLISESSNLPDPCPPPSGTVDAIILCFSLDSSVSLARILSSWSAVVSKSSITILVGTKLDLKRTSQANAFKDAMALSKQIGAATYLETSAKHSYSSTAAVFEAAAFSSLPPLSRQSSIMSTSSMISSSRKFVKNKRDQSEPRIKHLPPSHGSSLNCL